MRVTLTGETKKITLSKEIAIMSRNGREGDRLSKMTFFPQLRGGLSITVT
jgi:hypothetical protein